ncbi:MAG: hypothetical protein AAF490_30135 [Chloroflexota bacterium]
MSYVEEQFGILTDDDLYLDCVLVKPSEMEDENLRVLRVWVPKYPLTKSSVITCARQEVKSYGPKGKIAHLVFDLRGTGDSDGVMGDHNFALDLSAVKEWAKERFGRINFGFLGTPSLESGGRVNLWPLRAGSVLESYYYPPATSVLTPPCILYLSTYSNFSKGDDALCQSLAKAGYHVYGLDPLRYLLHASTQHRLKPDHLWDDLKILCQMLPSNPIILAQPLATGLALLWSSRVSNIRGVIGIGRAQAGLSPKHIFHNNNPYTFLVDRYVSDIAPRPLALIMHTKSSLGGDEDEMNGLFHTSKPPHRFERTSKLSLNLILELLTWATENSQSN